MESTTDDFIIIIMTKKKIQSSDKMAGIMQMLLRGELLWPHNFLAHLLSKELK